MKSKSIFKYSKLACQLLVILAVLGISACATNPDKIEAAYVSPTRYTGLNCTQLAEEAREIESKVTRLTGKQASKNKQDKWATGIGLVLFWPALFWLVSDDVKVELQQAKGEYEAIQAAAQTNGCS